MSDMTVLRRFDAATQALRSVTFKAWRGGVPVASDTLAGAEEFTEALNASLPGCAHKTVLTILREDAGRAAKELRFYTIKQSTKNGRWREAYDGGRKVFVGNLEPHLIHATAVREFEPVEAFDAFRDDPVGRDLTLVEARKRREGE